MDLPLQIFCIPHKEHIANLVLLQFVFIILLCEYKLKNKLLNNN
jgi:hypothetical protein